MKIGVSKIIHIQAKHSIEDWFLYDVEGIIKFLRLSGSRVSNIQKGRKQK